MADALQADVDNLRVTVNQAKPRKGVFEVRVGADVLVSTGPEERPFPALKALDMEDVIQRAKDAVNSAYQRHPHN